MAVQWIRKEENGRVLVQRIEMKGHEIVDSWTYSRPISADDYVDRQKLFREEMERKRLVKMYK